MTQTDAQIVVGVREGDILAGKYRIEKILGAGGMGVVVAAHHAVVHGQIYANREDTSGHWSRRTSIERDLVMHMQSLRFASCLILATGCNSIVGIDAHQLAANVGGSTNGGATGTLGGNSTLGGATTTTAGTHATGGGATAGGTVTAGGTSAANGSTVGGSSTLGGSANAGGLSAAGGSTGTVVATSTGGTPTAGTTATGGSSSSTGGDTSTGGTTSLGTATTGTVGLNGSGQADFGVIVRVDGTAGVGATQTVNGGLYQWSASDVRILDAGPHNYDLALATAGGPGVVLYYGGCKHLSVVPIGP